MHNDIKAIFFDWGGTLIERKILENNGFTFYKEIIDLLGINEDVESFSKKINAGYKEYKKWNKKYELEAPEEVILTKWLLPEYPIHIVLKYSKEISILFAKALGPRFLKDGVEETLKRLAENGYKLGLICNHVSRNYVMDEIKNFGFEKYFQCIIISSIEGIRKPDPRIFLKAAQALEVEPQSCTYVGDQPRHDVLGAKAAGFTNLVIIKSNLTTPIEDLSDGVMPDHVITEISELVSLFPKGNN